MYAKYVISLRISHTFSIGIYIPSYAVESHRSKRRPYERLKSLIVLFTLTMPAASSTATTDSVALLTKPSAVLRQLMLDKILQNHRKYYENKATDSTDATFVGESLPLLVRPLMC